MREEEQRRSEGELERRGTARETSTNVLASSFRHHLHIQIEQVDLPPLDRRRRLNRDSLPLEHLRELLEEARPLLTCVDGSVERGSGIRTSLEVGRVVEVGRETVVDELVLVRVGLVEGGVGRGVDVGAGRRERRDEGKGEEK